MDFHSSHQTAIMLTGTVALPAPFPACGSLCVVAAPEDGDIEIYIKIVQIVSARRIITRFARLADIRAIRAMAPGEAPCGPENWPIIGPKEVARQISKMENDLRAAAKKTASPCESEWLKGAIVYVPEAAPILHRNDVGVTAGVSAEDVAFSDLHATCFSHEGLGHCAIKPASFAACAKTSFCPGH